MNEFMTNLEALLARELFSIAGTVISGATVVTFIAVILATFLFSSVFGRGLRRALKLRGVSDEGSIGVTSRLVHYAIITIGLAIAFNTIGINLTALFAAGAVFAVAIGFAMQNISQNFVSAVWVDDPWDKYMRVVNEMHEHIWFALKDVGVTIAYPQLDVHIDVPVQKALDAMSRVE